MPEPTSPSAGLASGADPGIFEAWLASTDDGAIAVDPAGLVALHNPAASRVTGLAPRSALRRPWREVLHLESPIADALWRVRETGETARAVADVLCAQGNLRSTEISARPWDDTRGDRGILVLIRDLAILCRQRVAPAGRDGYGSLIGTDPSMRALYELVEVVAPSDAPALIEGETGVGKELLAQLLHARSRRAERPLIAVDCATVGRERLETELFGRARGPGGGPGGTVVGRVELAHTGTLFLDGVNQVSPALQIRLLRLLQSGEYERDGDPTPRRVDLRILAASDRPLDGEVQAGRFRDDLYFRLKLVRLAVPPLRERLADVPLLVEHFLARHGAAGAAVSPVALALLQSYAWPGNVRELDHAVRCAVGLWQHAGATGPIGPDLFPAEVRGGTGPRAMVAAAPVREDRRALLLRALSSHGGNRTAAARALGIGRATFYRWWREAGLGSAEPGSTSA